MIVKTYIEVLADFAPDGTVIPKQIIWRDGRVFTIDKISDVRRAASLKAGGSGIRYTCTISNKQTFLFLEESRWFVEEKIQKPS